MQKPEAPTVDFSGCNILLVEVNELNREITQTLLEMNGFLIELRPTAGRRWTNSAPENRGGLTCQNQSRWTNFWS